MPKPKPLRTAADPDRAILPRPPRPIRRRAPTPLRTSPSPEPVEPVAVAEPDWPVGWAGLDGFDPDAAGGPDLSLTDEEALSAVGQADADGGQYRPGCRPPKGGSPAKLLGRERAGPEADGLTSAQEEATAREVMNVLLAFAGVPADERAFLYDAEPDGSRTEGLEHMVADILRAVTPGGLLAHSPTLLDDIAADAAALGIVGERAFALAVYLVGTSRLLGRPLGAIAQGHSASGKSFVVTTMAAMFPPEAVLNATRMSPKALYRAPDLRHKFVVMGERSRAKGDESADATAALRQLFSEGRLTQLVTEADGEKGKLAAVHREVEGPISYVETTTLAPHEIFPEDLNRALLLKTDESPEQTRAILARSADRYAPADSKGDGRAAARKAIVTKHHQFQRGLQQLRVVIPDAAKIMAEMPTRKIEARRVANSVLAMIEVITLLHQAQRERDPSGALIATEADYQAARALLLQPLGESLGVPTGPARFYDRLAAKFRVGVSFNTRDAKRADAGASDRSVTNWLNALAAAGCVLKVGEPEGPNATIWRLTDKTPDSVVLPARAGG